MRVAELEARGAPPPKEHHRVRATGSAVLIVPAAVLSLLAVVAVWAHDQVSDTDRFVATMAPLANDPLLAGLALGLTLPLIEGGPRVSASRTIEVLGVIGVSVLGVTSLVFSLLFLVVEWVSGTFSPRLSLFRTDPAVWRAFALVVGLLAFAVSATLTIGSRSTVSLVVPVIAGAAAVVSLSLVRLLQLRALDAIQLNRVLANTAAQGHAVLDAFYPPAAPADQPSAGTTPHVLPPVRTTVVWRGPTVTVQQVDLRSLVASSSRARIGPSTRTRSTPFGCSPTSACAHCPRP